MTNRKRITLAVGVLLFAVAWLAGAFVAVQVVEAQDTGLDPNTRETPYDLAAGESTTLLTVPVPQSGSGTTVGRLLFQDVASRTESAEIRRAVQFCGDRGGNDVACTTDGDELFIQHPVSALRVFVRVADDFNPTDTSLFHVTFTLPGDQAAQYWFRTMPPPPPPPVTSLISLPPTSSIVMIDPVTTGQELSLQVGMTTITASTAYAIDVYQCGRIVTHSFTSAATAPFLQTVSVPPCPTTGLEQVLVEVREQSTITPIARATVRLRVLTAEGVSEPIGVVNPPLPEPIPLQLETPEIIQGGAESLGELLGVPADTAKVALVFVLMMVVAAVAYAKTKNQNMGILSAAVVLIVSVPFGVLPVWGIALLASMPILYIAWVVYSRVGGSEA